MAKVEISRVDFLVALAKASAATPEEQELVKDSLALILNAHLFLEEATPKQLEILDAKKEAWLKWKNSGESAEDTIKRKIGLI